MIEVKQITEEDGVSKCRDSITHSRSSLGEYSHPQCPEVYEKLIQDLEADVRKHIRVQQQLKLHIESVEDRVEELEIENESLLCKIGNETVKYKKLLETANKNIEILKKEKKKQDNQLKIQIEDNQKLKTVKDALNDELNKLKSLNIQNMQD